MGSGLIPKNAIRARVRDNIFSQWQGLTPSELRRRREERMENGVKNLKGASLFPKTFSNHVFGDVSSQTLIHSNNC
jgi:hypothetical protein